MKETIKKELVGKVVSATNNKTITVLVETYKTHPLYHKRVKQSKKYAVHDETNKAKVGDVVRIVSTKPISRNSKRSSNYIMLGEGGKLCYNKKVD